jgi:hypothetical protein
MTDKTMGCHRRMVVIDVYSTSSSIRLAPIKKGKMTTGYVLMVECDKDSLGLTSRGGDWLSCCW